AYHDPPRVESAAVVAWLRAHGVPEIHLATGDGPMGAQAVARALDITEVHAAALPEDKAAVVQQLQQAGHGGLGGGDGVDDAPALALANVSVSLAHGADIARETADVVLLEPRLTGLVRAIELSREALGLVRENLFLVGLPNGVALVLGLAGRLSPVAARLLSDSSTLLAAANSLRPLLTRDSGWQQLDVPRAVLP